MFSYHVHLPSKSFCELQWDTTFNMVGILDKLNNSPKLQRQLLAICLKYVSHTVLNLCCPCLPAEDPLWNELLPSWNHCCLHHLQADHPTVSFWSWHKRFNTYALILSLYLNHNAVEFLNLTGQEVQNKSHFYTNLLILIFHHFKTTYIGTCIEDALCKMCFAKLV